MKSTQEQSPSLWRSSQSSKYVGNTFALPKCQAAYSLAPTSCTCQSARALITIYTKPSRKLPTNCPVSRINTIECASSGNCSADVNRHTQMVIRCNPDLSALRNIALLGIYCREIFRLCLLVVYNTRASKAGRFSWTVRQLQKASRSAA